MRILIADKLAQEGIDLLSAVDGVEVDQKVGLSEEELSEIVKDYDGMVVRSGVQVTAKVLENPGNLRAVARAGVGVDNIDLVAATAKGVLVMNSAEASTITTAEHAFAMLMALARNIGPAYKRMSEGGWDRNKFVGTQLAGKTLGIVGFGRIGRTVAERALAFDMKVLAFDPVMNAEEALGGRVKLYNEFKDMLPELDFISFHVPLNDHTRGMLGKETFPLCKPNLKIVNAARGGVVDIEALIEALDNEQVGGAAIDVFEKEPPSEECPLRAHPKVLVTPHLGASTKEAQKAVSLGACEQLLQYLQGTDLRGAVNAPGVRMDLEPIQRKFVDLVERMAKLIGVVCDDGFKRLNVALDGEQLVSAAQTLERVALAKVLAQSIEGVNLVNASPFASERGIQVTTTIKDEHNPNPRVTLEIETSQKTRTITGSIYSDGNPRILDVDGFHMDVIPEGSIVVIKNDDRPGMIGIVGTTTGEANLNVADMAISRNDEHAMMVLKVDGDPSGVIEKLRDCDGILRAESLQFGELTTL